MEKKKKDTPQIYFLIFHLLFVSKKNDTCVRAACGLLVVTSFLNEESEPCFLFVMHAKLLNPKPLCF